MLKLSYPYDTQVIKVPKGVTVGDLTSEDGDYLVVQDNTPGAVVPRILTKKELSKKGLIASQLLTSSIFGHINGGPLNIQQNGQAYAVNTTNQQLAAQAANYDGEYY